MDRNKQDFVLFYLNFRFWYLSHCHVVDGWNPLSHFVRVTKLDANSCCEWKIKFLWYFLTLLSAPVNLTVWQRHEDLILASSFGFKNYHSDFTVLLCNEEKKYRLFNILFKFLIKFIVLLNFVNLIYPKITCYIISIKIVSIRLGCSYVCGTMVLLTLIVMSRFSPVLETPIPRHWFSMVQSREMELSLQKQSVSVHILFLLLAVDVMSCFKFLLCWLPTIIFCNLELGVEINLTLLNCFCLGYFIIPKDRNQELMHA